MVAIAGAGLDIYGLLPKYPFRLPASVLYKSKALTKLAFGSNSCQRLIFRFAKIY